MTEHLPECFASLCECDKTHFKSIDCDFFCICPSLRACEQRVMAAIDLPAANVQYQRVGYRNGLDAAREAAIRALTDDDGFVRQSELDDVLEYIDALREEKP